LYNVTVIIEENAAQEWVNWMKEEHIPAVMETGKFVSYRLLKVLDSPNEGITYCTQYIAETQEDYDAYQQLHAPSLQADLQTKFENRFVAFRTVMEFVG
ncbi:MAG: DUF4286 family protein, partial [Pedobacter sp.]|nr:DUF4286 family protein [Pedobacter sp.]